jgi:F0F1-type ATP synthase epsilon subunit
MNLTISSEKETKQVEVDYVEVHTPSGVFTLLNEHAPLISKVKKGLCLSYKIKETHTIETVSSENGGFFHFYKNKAMLILW